MACMRPIGLRLQFLAEGFKNPLADQGIDKPGLLMMSGDLLDDVRQGCWGRSFGKAGSFLGRPLSPAPTLPRSCFPPPAQDQ